MRRRSFKILGVISLAATVVFVVAGALLLVGYNFADDSVGTQLSSQKIYFPEAGSESLQDPRIKPYLSQYAGRQLVTGAQAKAYADHYIAVHVADVGKGTSYAGKTYAELGSLVRANPEDKALAAARETIFKGETLRGLLLNAYAWWTMGQVALWAAIGSFAVAGVAFIIGLFEFWRMRRAASVEELYIPRVIPERAAS